MSTVDRTKKWAKLWWDTDGNDIGWGWAIHEGEPGQNSDGGALSPPYPRGDTRLDALHRMTRSQLIELFQQEVPDWCEADQIEIDRALDYAPREGD